MNIHKNVRLMQLGRVRLVRTMLNGNILATIDSAGYGYSFKFYCVQITCHSDGGSG